MKKKQAQKTTQKFKGDKNDKGSMVLVAGPMGVGSEH
jgi:hypothetical protein